MENLTHSNKPKWLTVAMPLLETSERLERDKRENRERQERYEAMADGLT